MPAVKNVDLELFAYLMLASVSIPSVCVHFYLGERPFVSVLVSGLRPFCVHVCIAYPVIETIAGNQAPTVAHTAACCSTFSAGLLVGFLKHAAACRSTVKIGLGLFLRENIRPKY